MLTPGRQYTGGTGYRYGFNGKESDGEVKGEGNNYNYGERMYDPRIGRWLSLDPQFRRGPEFSPYMQSFDNPLNYLDEKGAWSIFTHYRIVKHTLMNLGVSKKTAEEIANYASTYADGGHGFILTMNQVIGIFGGTPPGKLAIKDKNDTRLNESQSDESIQMVSIHAMKTVFEGITDQQAVDRALHGGTFKDKAGKEIVVEGALNVVESFKGRDIEKLTTEEKKRLGVALHTIADAEAHKGKRWVNSEEGKKDAKIYGTKNEHNFFRDLFGFGGMKKAKEKTEEALKNIIEKKDTDNEKPRQTTSTNQ